MTLQTDPPALTAPVVPDPLDPSGTFARGEALLAAYEAQIAALTSRVAHLETEVTALRDRCCGGQAAVHIPATRQAP